MVSSIGNNQDNIQQMMAAMLQKMNAADTDGTTGLSKSELSSIDSSNDAGGAAFLKSLTDQFNSLDADGNGELSASEIANATPVSGQMGPPPGMSIPSDNTSSTSATSKTSKAGGAGGVDSTSTTTTSGTTATSSGTSTESSVEDLLDKLLEALLEKFSEKLGNSTSTATSDTTQKLSSLTKAADTDGSGSLSLDELSSLDSTSNTGQAGFVNDLEKNFGNYDTDGDGQLSQNELASAIKTPLSAQEHSAIADLNSENSSSGKSSLASLSNSFLEKLLSSYKDGDLSTITSALSAVS